MSQQAPALRGRRARFPRASGDEPSEAGRACLLVLFSPRERG